MLERRLEPFSAYQRAISTHSLTRRTRTGRAAFDAGADGGRVGSGPTRRYSPSVESDRERALLIERSDSFTRLELMAADPHPPTRRIRPKPTAYGTIDLTCRESSRDPGFQVVCSARWKRWRRSRMAGIRASAGMIGSQKLNIR
jgi:hypothetical protein